MTYSTVAQVKEILGITDSADDTELTSCVADADSRIDEWLRPHITVPLSSTPTEIAKISALLAAGVFRNRRSPNEGDKFIAQAEKRLLRYIGSNYLTGKFTGSGGLRDSS